jgi:hypothetical protein
MANGTIAFDTLSTSGQISGTAKSVDTDYVVSGSAKAWCHYIGSGTPSLNDSLNIASSVDNGTGNYTFSFSNSMSNVYYTVTSIDSRSGSASGGNRSIQGTFAVAAGVYSISNVYDASVFDDATLMMQILGDLA